MAGTLTGISDRRGKVARTLGSLLTAPVPKVLARREGIVLLANITPFALLSKVLEVVVSGEATRLDQVLLDVLHGLRILTHEYPPLGSQRFARRTRSNLPDSLKPPPH